jgi:hypothetical protein
VQRCQGELAAARASHAESTVIRRELWDRAGIAECLEGWAELAAVEEQPERAARLFGAAAALRETLGAPLPPSDRVEYERRLATLRSTLGEPAFASAWNAGRALTWQQAADDALPAGRASLPGCEG